MGQVREQFEQYKQFLLLNKQDLQTNKLDNYFQTDRDNRADFSMAQPTPINLEKTKMLLKSER